MMKSNYFFNIKNSYKIVFLYLFVLNTPIFAQNADVNLQAKTDFKLHKKGDFYINWGYNRSWFENSDIHFKGQGHDFILYNMTASDRPSPLNLDYINPVTWSIPQFNFRFGYSISSKYSLSIGWDHMKYVVDDFQTVKMYGYIDPSVVADPLMRENMSKLNVKYDNFGLYNDQVVQVTPDDFMRYEHTDGFNYATVDLERYDELWQFAKYDKLGLTFVSGLGLGVIVPRTDAHLFGSGRNHFWNLAGWGTHAKIGIQLNLTKHIYLQTDFKYGFVKMTDVRSSNHYNIDGAQQNIVFYENYWQIGFRF